MLFLIDHFIRSGYRLQKCTVIVFTGGVLGCLLSADCQSILERWPGDVHTLRISDFLWANYR